MAENRVGMARNYTRVAGWLLSLPGLVDRAFARLARNKRWCVAGVGLFALLLRLALHPILGVPAPGGHDEFSQLLLADTFAHGRLTNPVHPMWIHFESFHIIHQPTYSSIYPPAQGLVLAAGQLLGHPWIGELLITALMCAAICWMLQGWLPPKWALYGAVLALLRLGVFSYWMDGYWATSVVALGGTLVLGALPRITRHQRHQRQQRIGDALWLALGLAILANTRPYEGLVLATLVGAALLFWMLGPAGPALGVSLKRIVAPAGLLLAVTALATGYFYYRVGGSPFRLTYVIDSQIYNPVPFFLWQQAGPLPAYNHETLRQFYELDLQRWVEHRAHLLNFSVYRAAGLYFTFLGPYLAIPLLVMPWLWRDRGMRFALIAGALFLVALLGESWALPHYAAPATGLLFLIVAQCSRRIALLRLFHFRIGRLAVQAILVLVAVALVSRMASAVANSPKQRRWFRSNPERGEMMSHLGELPGKHVVVVAYAPAHDTDNEWVYNSADIDGAKVVWARDMGVEKNRALQRYFADRAFWTITVNDKTAPVLSRYPPDESGHAAK
jgi:hypothetical protein